MFFLPSKSSQGEKISIMGVSKTTDPIKVKIKIPLPREEPPVSIKTTIQDFKDMSVLCTFKIKIKSQNLDHGCMINLYPYQNQDQDSKLYSGTVGVLQSPKSGLKGHGFSMHLKNKDTKPKFGSWVHQRP